MLEAVYASPHVSHSWGMFDFIYGRANTIVIRDRGYVVDSFLQYNGTRQGGVLSGLGFACLFQPIYKAAIDGKPSTTATAIVDDFTVTGMPREAFPAFDKYQDGADGANVKLNLGKTLVQVHTDHPDLGYIKRKQESED